MPVMLMPRHLSSASKYRHCAKWFARELLCREKGLGGCRGQKRLTILGQGGDRPGPDGHGSPEGPGRGAERGRDRAREGTGRGEARRDDAEARGEDVAETRKAGAGWKRAGWKPASGKSASAQPERNRGRGKKSHTSRAEGMEASGPARMNLPRSEGTDAGAQRGEGRGRGGPEGRRARGGGTKGRGPKGPPRFPPLPEERSDEGRRGTRPRQGGGRRLSARREGRSGTEADCPPEPAGSRAKRASPGGGRISSERESPAISRTDPRPARRSTVEPQDLFASQESRGHGKARVRQKPALPWPSL